MGLGDIAGSLLDAVTGQNFKRPVLEDDQGTKIILDVVPDQQRDGNSTVSRHAVESAVGSISDNVKSDPRVITVKVVLSNYTGMSALNPVSYARTVKSVFGATENTIKPRVEILYKWRDQGILLTYRSRQMVMKNCVVQKITESVNEATGDGLGLTLTIAEVFIANSAAVAVDLKKPRGAKPTKKKNESAAKIISEQGISGLINRR